MASHQHGQHSHGHSHDHGHCHEEGEDDYPYDVDPNVEPMGAHIYLGLVYSLTNKTAKELNLLDLGCGPGTYVKHFMDKGLGKATMVDCDNRGLEKARSLLEPHKDRVKIELHSVPNLPYPESTFDVVTMNSALHHFYDPATHGFDGIRETLEVAKRVLKPGGVVIILEPTALQAILHWSSFFQSHILHFLELSLTSKKIFELFESVGFMNRGSMVFPHDDVPVEKVFSPFKEEATPVPDYDTMVGAVSCPEEREKLKKLTGCAESLADSSGKYTIYYAQKK